MKTKRLFWAIPAILLAALPARAVPVHVFEQTLLSDGTATQLSDTILRTGSNYVTQAAPAMDGWIFTHWSISTAQEFDGRDRWGRAREAAPYLLQEETTLTANYLPASQDSDADGVADGWEIYWYGNLAESAQSDTDGDTFTFSDELTMGTNPHFFDEFAPDRIEWADSSPLQSIFDETIPVSSAEPFSILAEGDLIPGVAIRLGGAPDGWTLHYTTNGSNPTAESPAYTGPFVLDGSATVKVVATSDAHGWMSGVAEQRFDLAPPLAVTGARARQRYPWNGLVDVDFTLEGDAARRYRVTVVAEDLDGGTNLAARTVWEDCGSVTNAALDVAPGLHRFVWNADADLPAGFVADLVAIDVRAEAIHDTALYMVVDLSGGPDAERYPVSYLPDVPEGGWTDEYKTDKLVLRRVEPGWFTMGSSELEIAITSGTSSLGEAQHEVTLTKPFYAGVFETTQRQWERIMRTRPSYFVNETCYATRPVETIHWTEIRGDDAGNGWPDDAEVDNGSFMAVLRAKTNDNGFDLPTEAQWEYACRAGTTSSFNNGKNVTNLENDPNANLVGRNLQNGGEEGVRVRETEIGTCNADDSIGTAKVGSYLPNAWGVFDMHGNVTEQCLDWNQAFTAEPVVDPIGPRDGEQFISSVGVQRIARGSSIHHRGTDTHSSRRHGYPVNVAGDFKGDDGFRLFLHNAPAVVEAPIVAPAGLTATTNRTGDVMLSWEPVAGTYAYQIRRSKTGSFEDGTWLNTVTNTTYADWTAEAGADYAYWVRAQFESGRVGAWSEAAESKRSVTYTVRFNANGGSGSMPDIELYLYHPQALPTNTFVRNGYNFTGWARSMNGAQAFADGDTVVNLASTEHETVELYACWAVTTYTVQYNANGGNGTMADQTFAYDETQALRAKAFTRYKYRLAGWSKTASGSVQYADKASVTNIGEPGSVVTLYAVWDYNPLGEGIDQIDLIWTTDSTNPWNFYTSEKINSKTYTPYDKSDGIKSSGAGGGAADSWVQTKITGPATFSFRYAKRHYSSTFTVKVDSSVVFTDKTGTSDSQGVVGWTQKSFSVGSGTHTIRFNYHHSGVGFAAGGNGIRLDTMTVTYK